MKRKTSLTIVFLMLIAGLVLLCSCGKDIGVIGGSDGPTSIVLGPGAKPAGGPDGGTTNGEAAGPAPAGETHRINILMYHHLCEDESDVNSQTVTAAKFRSDMQWLIDNGYSALLPREIAGKSSVPEKSVIISFDDGYRSNYALAYPILKELGLKAEISVITYNIEHSGEYTIFMNWDEVKELSDSGIIEIGSHTDSLHNPEIGGELYLGGAKNGVDRAASADDLKADLKASADMIEEHTGIRPTTFAYPYGAAQTKGYNDIVDSIFPVNFSTNPGTADLANGTKRLPRYRINQDTRLDLTMQ